ncbi:thioredoxin-like protein, partial [Paraphysoderma sedebokerense]
VTLISSSADFKRAISQNKLTVVDFYAVWCGPCKAIAPKFESFSSTYSNAAFIKVNVDDLNVAASCSVRAMPTFQFYRNGKKIDEVVGAN